MRMSVAPVLWLFPPAFERVQGCFRRLVLQVVLEETWQSHFQNPLKPLDPRPQTSARDY